VERLIEWVEWGERLFDPVGDIGVVPFPCFTVVVRKCLTPDRLVWIGLVPSEHDNHGFSYLIIFCEEQADPVVKGAYLGWVDRAALAVHPVEAPKFCLRVEGADRSAFVHGAVGHLPACNIKISHSFQARMVFCAALEFGVFFTALEPGVQVFILHVPISDEEVEVLAG
jgi:hypothetical protein